MNPLAQEALTSVARSVLKIAAGYLVARGVWTPEDATTYVAAAALALVGLGWSFYQTYTARQKLVTAMAMPSGVTENVVKAAVDNPNIVTPPVSLPKDQVPDPITSVTP